MLHTERRDTILDIGRRLETAPAKSRPVTWLFPTLESAKLQKANAPGKLSAKENTAWAKRRYDRDLETFYEGLTDRLSPGADLSAKIVRGELQFLIDGVVVVQGLFPSAPEANFILAQWNYIASTFEVTARTNGKSFANVLRKLAVTDQQGRIQQVIDLQERLTEIEDQIAIQEIELDQIIFGLYGFSEDQINLIKTH